MQNGFVGAGACVAEHVECVKQAVCCVALEGVVQGHARGCSLCRALAMLCVWHGMFSISLKRPGCFALLHTCAGVGGAGIYALASYSSRGLRPW
jgi:hypothetical protein